MAVALTYVAASGLRPMPPIPTLTHAPVPTPVLTGTSPEGADEMYAPYDYYDNYAPGGLCFSFIVWI